MCDISKGIITLLNDLLLFAGAYAVYYSINDSDRLWKKKKDGDFMRNKEIIYNGKQLARVSKRKIKTIIKNKKENDGKTIYILPCLANLESPFICGFIELNIDKNVNEERFYNEINLIEYYNCNKEIGKYLVFYIEK